MNINQELVEKVKSKRFCIFNNGTADQLNDVLHLCLGNNIFPASGDSEYYFIEGREWYSDNNQHGVTPIPLSSFFLPTSKMIPVDELERLVINRDVWLESFDDHKKGMNALFDKLQEKINKYK